VLSGAVLSGAVLSGAAGRQPSGSAAPRPVWLT